MSKVIIEHRERGIEEHRERFAKLLSRSRGVVRVASPYITETKFLLSDEISHARLITTLTARNVATNATSVQALRKLIRSGVECRFVPESLALHAKVYMFGSSRAVVTSANLTNKALGINVEVGVEVGVEQAAELVSWFDGLWDNHAEPLTDSELNQVQQEADKINVVRDLDLKTRQLHRKLSRLLSSRRRSFIKTAKLRQALRKGERFFVCHTNRRNSARTSYGAYFLEEAMRKNSRAIAWPDPNSPYRLDKVSVGDLILMYASIFRGTGGGIIGIGLATDAAQVLPLDHPDRIRPLKNDGRDREEWFIPVEWSVWQPENPCKVSVNQLGFHQVSMGYAPTLAKVLEEHFCTQT